MTGVKRRMAALTAAALIGIVPPSASADPWKDESGKGRERWEDGWRGDRCRGRGCDADERWDDRYDRRDDLDEDLIRCNRDIIGGVLGGATGGVLGSRVEDEELRAAATIGGAILGVLIGGAIGRAMDRRDQACIGHALEYAGSGAPVRWRDPTGILYEVVPDRPYRIDDGRYCRDYRLLAEIEGRRRATEAKACRRRDGVWVAAAD